MISDLIGLGLENSGGMRFDFKVSLIALKIWFRSALRQLQKSRGGLFISDKSQINGPMWEKNRQSKKSNSHPRQIGSFGRED